MAITKSAKIEAEIEKVKAKIAEQQARLKNWSRRSWRPKTARSWRSCAA